MEKLIASSGRYKHLNNDVFSKQSKSTNFDYFTLSTPDTSLEQFRKDYINRFRPAELTMLRKFLRKGSTLYPAEMMKYIGTMHENKANFLAGVDGLIGIEFLHNGSPTKFIETTFCHEVIPQVKAENMTLYADKCIINASGTGNLQVDYVRQVVAGERCRVLKSTSTD